jgi:ABC-type molybdate transport system ATPase subunit
MRKIMTNGNPPARQSYYLVAGEIVFSPSAGETSSSVLMNTLVITQDNRFAVAQIAKAQQAMQFQFIKRMNNPTLQILDVIIVSLMPLGEFTDAEFNATPAGMKIEEVNTEDLFKASEEG